MVPAEGATVSALPCIVGTGPRAETCGGCAYRKWAPRDPGVDALWGRRCTHPNGHRASREAEEIACQYFTGKKTADLTREALP